MTSLFHWIFFLLSVALLPVLVLGTIRKTKARLQNRIGPPLWQPFYDLVKLAHKGETLSLTMCGVFRLSSIVVFADILVLAWLTPWLCFKPWAPEANIFMLVYLFALARMFTLLGSLDSGSAFGAFSASREATLGLLVEPAVLLALVALGIFFGSSDLRVIFSLSSVSTFVSSAIWIAAGLAIFFSSLVELSRMPVDDPTTHLELTMIHEAMILEASGRNLALIEFAHALKMCIFFGLASQCFLRAIPQFSTFNIYAQGGLNIAGLLGLAMFVGLLESLTVKLQWRKVPEFIAYILSLSLIASFTAIGIGAIK